MLYYLSGSITKTRNFKEIFKDAETQLRFLGITDIFNPAEVNLRVPYTEKTKRFVWKLYMQHDIKKLLEADVLVLLPGWWKSKGVKLELIICYFMKIKVVSFNKLVRRLRYGTA